MVISTLVDSGESNLREINISDKLQALWDKHAKGKSPDSVGMNVATKNLVKRAFSGGPYLQISRQLADLRWNVFRTNWGPGSHQSTTKSYPAMSATFKAETGEIVPGTVGLHLSWPDSKGLTPFVLSDRTLETQQVVDVLTREIDRAYQTHCLG
ncbi:MAG: hypothetical protein AAF244_03220 [Pseudomonadota bacterium]